MLANVIFAAFVVVASCTSCVTHNDCKNSSQYCLNSAFGPRCDFCSNCPGNIGFTNGPVGNVCPSWCVCQGSSDCTASQYCSAVVKNGYHQCSSCSSGCADGMSTETTCPPKCNSYYACSTTSDCSSISFCNKAHVCKACGPTCTNPQTSGIPTAQTVGPIDGNCPASCCGYYGMDGDNKNLVYSSCYNNTGKYTFTAGLGSLTLGVTTYPDTCTSTVQTVPIGHTVYSVSCPDLATSRTTCDSTKMKFASRVLYNMVPFTNNTGTYYETNDRSLLCAIEGAILGLFAIICIVIGAVVFCIILAVCACCGGFAFCCRMAGRQQTTTHIVYQQPPQGYQTIQKA